MKLIQLEEIWELEPDSFRRNGEYMEKMIEFQKNESLECQKSPLPKSKKTHSVNPNKPYSQQKIKILVVEDKMILQFSLSEMLKNLGYIADFVADGKAALASYCKDYHLILMDVDIPYLNGIEVTKIIRAIEENHQFQNVPIVAMTSHVDEPEYQNKCLSAGMNGIYGKPTADQLKTLIQEYTTH